MNLITQLAEVGNMFICSYTAIGDVNPGFNHFHILKKQIFRNKQQK
jgi:hypothetical protein